MNWGLLVDIAVPILSAVAAVLVAQVVRSRPKLRFWQLSQAAVDLKKFEPDGNTPPRIHTHSILIQNVGDKSATNVRITHNVLTDFSIHPSLPYRIENLDLGGADIVIDRLIPRQLITINYVYFPPLQWTQIVNQVKSDEVFAKTRRVKFSPDLSTWQTTLLWGALLSGCVGWLYVMFQIVNLIVGAVATQ